jgi:hypothetical protein
VARERVRCCLSQSLHLLQPRGEEAWLGIAI